MDDDLFDDKLLKLLTCKLQNIYLILVVPIILQVSKLTLTRKEIDKILDDPNMKDPMVTCNLFSVLLDSLDSSDILTNKEKDEVSFSLEILFYG